MEEPVSINEYNKKKMHTIRSGVTQKETKDTDGKVWIICEIE